MFFFWWTCGIHNSHGLLPKDPTKKTLQVAYLKKNNLFPHYKPKYFLLWIQSGMFSKSIEDSRTISRLVPHFGREWSLLGVMLERTNCVEISIDVKKTINQKICYATAEHYLTVIFRSLQIFWAVVLFGGPIIWRILYENPSRSRLKSIAISFG